MGICYSVTLNVLHVKYRQWVDDAGVQSINQVDVSSMLVNPVPAGEEWRIPLLQDLRESVKQNPGFMDTEDIKLRFCDFEDFQTLVNI